MVVEGVGVGWASACVDVSACTFARVNVCYVQVWVFVFSYLCEVAYLCVCGP